MADYTDPRGYGAAPRTPHETHVHYDRTPPRSGISSLAFVVGGLLVAVLVLFFVFGGAETNPNAPTAPAPVGNNTSITIDPATPAVPAPAEQPAPALEQPIPGVPTETVPAPAD